MKLIGTLGSNDTTNIGMISSVSKATFNKISHYCIHILNDKESLNLLKGGRIMQMR